MPGALARDIERTHARSEYWAVIRSDRISCMTLFFMSFDIQFNYHEQVCDTISSYSEINPIDGRKRFE